MTVPNIPSGNFVLPVCVSSQGDIVDLLSALDLYRKLRKKSEDYPIADAVYDALEYADNPQDSPCLDITVQSSGECFTIPTTSAGIQFFYNNPFETTEIEPRVGKWSTWAREKNRTPQWVQDLLELADDISIFDSDIGYFDNDCFVVLPDEKTGLFGGVQTFLSFIDGLANVEIPHVRIDFEGSGQLEIELLGVPFGGSAMIRYDNDGLINDAIDALFGDSGEQLQNTIFTELQRDIISIPPEAKATNVIEIDFNDETPNTEHYVTVYFLPRFNDELTALAGIGGGIRSVTACGDIRIKNVEQSSFINSRNYGLEQHRREGIIMGTEQDFYDALIRYENQRAKRWLLGQDGNIESGIELSNNTDYLGGGSGSGGGITVVPSKSVGSQNLTSSSRDIANGQAYGVAENFIALLNRVKSWRNSGLTQLEIEQRLIDLYHITNPSQAMTTYFANAINDLVLPTVDQLAQDVYESASNAIGIAENAYRQATEASRNILIDFGNAVGENLGLWEAQGEERPRDEWRAYPSTLLEPISFEFTPTSILAMVHNVSESLAYESTQLFSAGSQDDRLARIEVSGVLTDSDGKTFDGVSLETGTETAKVGLRFCDYSGGVYSYASPTGLLPSPSQKTNGKYGYNVLRTNPHYANLFFGVNSAIYNRNWVSGRLSIEIFDLGVSE